MSTATVRSPAAGTAAPQAQPAAHSRHALLLAVCCTAQFMVILDVSIVNVALPSIRESLGFSAIDLQWIVNAYAVTFAGFLMLGGRAADLFGQRRVFMTGLLLFAFASLAGGVAQSQGMLIGARALQGLGGAIMAPASLAIINSSYAPGPERLRAIGLWGAMSGAGGAAGVLAGGVITQTLGWRWILLINIPIGIAAALVASAAVAERRREDAGSFDLAGALSITGGLLALVYGIVSAGADSWGSAEALGPIALGIVLLVAFVVIEARFATDPLVPLRAFSIRLLRISNLIVLTFSAALFPMWYFLSLYLQLVLHMTPIGAGLAFLPMALTIMVCATRAGRLVGRYGAGPVLGVGLTLMAAGLALFARITVDGGYGQDLLLPGLLASIGVGLAFVPATIAATAGVAPSEAGLASGLVNTSRQMGGALGLALLTSLGTQYTAHLISSDYQPPLVALTNGFRLAFLISAGFAAIGAATAFRFIPRVRPGRPPAAPPSTGATVHPLPVAPHAAPPPPLASAAVSAAAQTAHDATPPPPKKDPEPIPPAPVVPPRPPATVSFRLPGERRWPLGGCFTIPVVIEAGERG